MLKALGDVKPGDEIVKVNPDGGVGFTTVLALPSSPTTAAVYELRVAPPKRHVRRSHNEEQHLVEATADHTFIRCDPMIEDGASNEELVKAKNIKVGDCLRTVHGDKLVSSTRLLEAAEAAEHETYTVVTAGGSADWIVVGGLLARATDAKKVGMM